MLSVHGIDEARWDVLRAHAIARVDGEPHLAPETVERILDAALAPLLAPEIEARRQASLRGREKGSAPRAELTAAQQQWFDGWLARRLDDERFDLEIALRAYVADEVGFAHMEPDAASRRITLWGTRPGSVAGEMFRTVMLFKGFPFAFTGRVLGRAIKGGDGGRGTAGPEHTDAPLYVELWDQADDDPAATMTRADRAYVEGRLKREDRDRLHARAGSGLDALGARGEQYIKDSLKPSDLNPDPIAAARHAEGQLVGEYQFLETDARSLVLPKPPALKTRRPSAVELDAAEDQILDDPALDEAEKRRQIGLLAPWRAIAEANDARPGSPGPAAAPR